MEAGMEDSGGEGSLFRVAAKPPLRNRQVCWLFFEAVSTFSSLYINQGSSRQLIISIMHRQQKFLLVVNIVVAFIIFFGSSPGRKDEHGTRSCAAE